MLGKKYLEFVVFFYTHLPCLTEKQKTKPSLCLTSVTRSSRHRDKIKCQRNKEIQVHWFIGISSRKVAGPNTSGESSFLFTDKKAERAWCMPTRLPRDYHNHQEHKPCLCLGQFQPQNDQLLHLKAARVQINMVHNIGR